MDDGARLQPVAWPMRKRRSSTVTHTTSPRLGLARAIPVDAQHLFAVLARSPARLAGVAAAVRARVLLQRHASLAAAAATAERPRPLRLRVCRASLHRAPENTGGRRRRRTVRPHTGGGAAGSSLTRSLNALTAARRHLRERIPTNSSWAAKKPGEPGVRASDCLLGVIPSCPRMPRRVPLRGQARSVPSLHGFS